MKVIGFVTGAALAAIGVVAHSALTTVTDDARFERMLTACVDYVTTGAHPFAGEGRTVGVYDAPLFEGDYVADTHRILDDNRFEAAWETVMDVADPIRLCRVTARFDGADQMGFDLSEDNFIPWVTELLAPAADVRPETDSIESGPRTLGWYEVGKPQAEGLRVVLIAEPGKVGSFLVVNDLDD
jgi:hypothetical protein